MELNAFNYEEFLEFCEKNDGKYELVDGIIVDLGSPGIHHEIVVANIISQLNFTLAHTQCYVGASNIKVRTKHNRSRLPDTLVICKDDTTKPKIVVEVISKNSRNRDWREKLREYFNVGILEYWVVDKDERCLTVISNLSNTKTIEIFLNEDEFIESKVFPEIRIPMQMIFRGIDALPDEFG